MIKKALITKVSSINNIKIIISLILLSLIVTISIYLTNNNLTKLKVENIINSNSIAIKIQETYLKSIDEYLKEYSTYYNLDGNKVIEFARSITDNYNINLNEVTGRIKSNTTEGQVMMFVYYLSRDGLNKPLSEYNTQTNYFKTNNEIITMDENQILRSGLTFSQFLGKVCDNLGVSKDYLLSISYLETGKNTSRLALRSNNFGGLRGSGEYFSYDTPEMGIIAYVVNLKGYEKYNLNNIYELSGIYTHGSKYNPSETWVSKVYKYYDDIVNNPSKYFIIEGAYN